MQSFYFGSSEQPLYAVHHAPIGGQYRSTAIVICNPLGHEYVRSHKALCTLATKLSESGFHVLRFDYSSTGDSSGDFCDAKLESWVTEIELAISEIKAISLANKVSLIGLRMGAMLALLCKDKSDLSSLILWDPIFDGDQYIESIAQQQKNLVSSTYSFGVIRDPNDSYKNEYIGYLYAEPVLSLVKSFSTDTICLPAAIKLTIISSNLESTPIEAKKYDALSTKMQVAIVDDLGGWDQLEYIATTFMPNEAIKHICESLA